MKFLVIGLMFASSLVLSACGNENPLKGMDRSIQEAEKPGGQGAQAEEEKDLRILVQDDFFRFKEDKTTKFSIEGRALNPKAGINIEITNLASFPGATYDMITGIFEWTPPVGFVTGNSTRTVTLSILLTTTNVAPAGRREKNVPVIVESSQQAPEVVSMTFPGGAYAKVREGSVLDIEVVVRDATAADTRDERPTLTFEVFKGYSVPQDAGMLTINGVPKVDPLDPSLWTFKVKLDLRNREVTKNEDSLRIVISAVSRYRIVSAKKGEYITVQTNLENPVVSWVRDYEMQVGKNSAFTYLVWNPKGEGNVEQNMISSCAKIHPALSCKACVKDSDTAFGNFLRCDVAWDIPADYLDKGGSSKVTLDFDVRSVSSISGDSGYATTPLKISRTIRIFAPVIVNN